MYRFEFVLPGLPSSTNVLRTRHFRTNAKEANKWKFAISKAIPAQTKPPQPLKYIRIELERHSSRAMDYDNLVASFKCVLDAMVLEGIILHDGPEIIRHENYICRWVKHPNNKTGFIKVKIEETIGQPN